MEDTSHVSDEVMMTLLGSDEEKGQGNSTVKAIKRRYWLLQCLDIERIFSSSKGQQHDFRAAVYEKI